MKAKIEYLEGGKLEYANTIKNIVSATYTSRGLVITALNTHNKTVTYTYNLDDVVVTLY